MNPSSPTRSWVETLTPARAGVTFDFGDDAVQLYHRLRWRGRPPRNCVVTAAQAWAAPVKDRHDRAFDVSARTETGEPVNARLVIRSSAPIAPFGDGSLPRCPSVGADRAESRVAGEVVFTEPDVLGFADRLGAWPAIHVDPDFCRRAGFSGLVVQGLKLLDHHIEAGGPAEHGDGGHGDVEIWFRHPVCAGEAITIVHHDQGLTSMQLAGSGNLAAVIRTNLP